MALRFFADHCVASTVITTLGQKGHEVLRLRDHMAVESLDTAVLAKAQSLDAILVSLNGDFSDIVQFPPQQHGGVVALQVRNHPETTGAILSRLLDYISRRTSRENALPREASHRRATPHPRQAVNRPRAAVVFFWRQGPRS